MEIFGVIDLQKYICNISFCSTTLPFHTYKRNVGYHLCTHRLLTQTNIFHTHVQIYLLLCVGRKDNLHVNVNATRVHSHHFDNRELLHDGRAFSQEMLYFLWDVSLFIPFHPFLNISLHVVHTVYHTQAYKTSYPVIPMIHYGYGMAWHDMAWHIMTWHNMIWYDMTWNDNMSRHEYAGENRKTYTLSVIFSEWSLNSTKYVHIRVVPENKMCLMWG